MERRLRRASGHSPRSVDARRRPMSRSGVSSTAAIRRSTTPAMSGRTGPSSDTMHAAPMLPARRGRAVAVHDAQHAIGMEVGELHGDGTPHGMPEQHGALGPDIVEQVADDVGDLVDRDALPRQRIAPGETGQARVQHAPAERLGEVAALPPVHPAAGEVPVEVDGPDGFAARALGSVRFRVVRQRVPDAPAVDHQLVGDHAHRTPGTECRARYGGGRGPVSVVVTPIVMTTRRKRRSLHGDSTTLPQRDPLPPERGTSGTHRR